MISADHLPAISRLQQLTSTPPEYISGSEYWRISTGPNVNLFYVQIPPEQTLDLHAFDATYKDAIVQVRSGQGELVIDGFSRHLIHDDLVDVVGGMDAQLINLSKFNLSLILFIFSM